MNEISLPFIENLRQNLPIYLIALITWLGVLAYLFRLEAMTRALEKQTEIALAGREAEENTDLPPTV